MEQKFSTPDGPLSHCVKNIHVGMFTDPLSLATLEFQEHAMGMWCHFSGEVN